MIVFYRPKGRPSGITPKEKKQKKSKGFSIVIRDKSKSAKAPKSNIPDATADLKKTLINECITNKFILEFEYQDKKGKVLHRYVEPQKLDMLNGETVLYAFCLQNEGIRIFILANMKDLKKSDLNGNAKQR